MKKATTIDEQIEILKGRGLIINDVPKAKEVLLDVGFYRLGFYSFPFEKTFPTLTNRDHQFCEGTTFEDIVSLYYFDYDLRNILTYYLNRIEVNFRTYLTYTVSNRYKTSPTWFVDSNVVTRIYADEFENKVYKNLLDNPVIRRHHLKYINDRFAPAWKTLEFLTLGNTCSLYQNLKDNQLRQDIARHYKCNENIFRNYLHTIRIIRNTCAHGACIFNIALPQGIKSGPIKISEEMRHNICGIISVINYILKQISDNRRKDMNVQIKELLQKPRSERANDILRKCSNLSFVFLDNQK